MLLSRENDSHLTIVIPDELVKSKNHSIRWLRKNTDIQVSADSEEWCSVAGLNCTCSMLRIATEHTTQ